MVTLAKAEACPRTHSARLHRGGGGPLHHAQAHPLRLLAPPQLALEFSTGGVGAGRSVGRGAPWAVSSVLAAPPGGRGQVPSPATAAGKS